MLPDYGVVIGKYQSHSTNQGKWMHVDLSIDASGVIYEAAVDVNEPNGQFQYRQLHNLDQKRFAGLSALPDGWHHLDSTPTSGAMDYARSPILGGPASLRTILASFWNSLAKPYKQHWTNVTGNEAGQALVAMLNNSRRIYAFGAPYTTGKGVHDVHCNQGDPPGPFRPLDGIWQDGCVFVTKADGTLSAYLGKFATQSLNTDDHGLPV